MTRKVSYFTLLLALFFVFGCTSHKIDSKLKQAEELKGTRDLSGALQVYQGIVNTYPRDKKTSTAYLKMGDLYLFSMDQPDQALEAYKKVVERWPFSKDAEEASIKRGDIYSNKAERRVAIAEYEWVIVNFPASKSRDQVLLKLAEEYIALGDYYQSYKELEKLLSFSDVPKDIRAKALFDLGESHLLMGSFDKSFQTYQKFEKEFPESMLLMDVRLKMVESLEKANKIDEALALMEKVVQIYPQSDVIQKAEEGLHRRTDKTEKPEMDRSSEEKKSEKK